MAQEALGGLELAQGGAPTFDFGSAIMRLRTNARSLEPDAIDQFAQRANGAFPTWKEMQSRIETELSNSQREGATSLDKLEHPPINRGLPWLKFAAGMMGPTKTGSFGESLGAGIGGYAQGAEENQKSDLDFTRRAAEMRHTLGNERVKGVEGMYGLGLRSEQLEASLAMMRQRMGQSMLTPALKEWAVVNGIDTSDPQWMSKLTPEKRAEAMKFVNLARGTTQTKNAAAMLNMLNPGHPDFPKVTSILANQPLMAKLHAQAMQMVPREQYIGKGVGEYETALNEAFQGLVQQTVNTGIPANFVPGATAPGATGAPPPPASGAPNPAGPPNPASPGAASSNAADQQSLGNVEVKDFPSYIASQAKAWQQNPKIVQDKSSREKMDAAAVKDWETNVQPGVHAGEEMINAVSSLDVINPQTTPAAALVEMLGKAGSVLGLPENNALVKRAAELDTGRKVVAELQNGILMKAHGVQTDNDARRALQQIASMTDMPQVYEATKALMRAIGQRMIDKGEFFNRYGEMNAGQFTGANTEWARLATDQPLIKRVKFKDGSYGFLTYKELIDQHIKSGDGVEGALKALRAKE